MDTSLAQILTELFRLTQENARLASELKIEREKVARLREAQESRNGAKGKEPLAQPKAPEVKTP